MHTDCANDGEEEGVVAAAAADAAPGVDDDVSSNACDITRSLDTACADEVVVKGAAPCMTAGAIDTVVCSSVRSSLPAGKEETDASAVECDKGSVVGPGRQRVWCGSLASRIVVAKVVLVAPRR